jgi:hypothetical protein
VPRTQPSSRTLRPRPAALLFAALVGVVSVGLLGFGLQDLLLAHQPLGLPVAAIGGYGLLQVARTPLALDLGPDGVLRLRALTAGGAVRADSLARVHLVQTSALRPDVYRFLRPDASVAFSSDAGLWDQKQLRELLASIGVRIETPGGASP